jgi:hypothetical protein
MTILLLLFLSGLILQGLKMLVGYAVNQMKAYVENYDETAVELFSGKTNHINLDALVFNEERSIENYAFVRSSTQAITE